MDAEQKELIKQLAQMGDVVLITDGNRINLNDNGEISLETQADAVLYFLQRLDINMLEMILENQRTYQDFEKSLFINKLSNAFDEFIKWGNTYLNRYEGFCNSELCNFKSKGFSFVGNKSGHYFNLIIDSKEGVIHDIYECESFESCNQNLERSYRITIDDDIVPF